MKNLILLIIFNLFQKNLAYEQNYKLYPVVSSIVFF